MKPPPTAKNQLTELICQSTHYNECVIFVSHGIGASEGKKVVKTNLAIKRNFVKRKTLKGKVLFLKCSEN